jgi:uncharacterized protein YjeT (DUF2065 family)
MFVYSTKKKAEQRIRDAFGKAPSREREDLEYLTSYHMYASDIHSDKVILDEITWNDLNMDDVFQRINACSCSIGEEYLYHVLHELKTNSSDLEKREQLLEWMEAHPEERVQLQKILLGIGRKKYNGLSFFLFHASAKKLRNAWLYIVLALLPVAGILLMPFGVKAGFLLLLCAAHDAGRRIGNHAVFLCPSLWRKVHRAKIGQSNKASGVRFDGGAKAFSKDRRAHTGRSTANNLRFGVLHDILQDYFSG